MQLAPEYLSPTAGHDSVTPDPLLRFFLGGDPRTRRSVVAQSGMARSTVNPRLEALVRSGVLVEHEGVVSTGGRPPTTLQLNAGYASVAAIEIEGGYLRVTVTDLGQEVLAEAQVYEPLDADPEQTMQHLARMLTELAATPDLPPIVGIGVGVTMPIDPRTGRPIHPALKPRWHDYDIAGRLQQVLEVPVHVDGMNYFLALGELAHDDELRGSEDSSINMLYVHVSTFIAAGIVIDGRIVHGATGQIGHIGHIRGHWDEDDECICGKRGCLEAIASGATLVRRFGHRLPTQSVASVVEAARDGDPEILAALREAGRRLGTVVAGYVSVLNPSVVVIGGELMDAGAEYLTGVREGVHHDAFPMSTADLTVRAARAGRQAAVVGSARFAAHHYLAPTQP